MIIATIKNLEEVNKIMNDVDVKTSFGFSEDFFDSAPMLENKDCIVFLFDGAVFLLHPLNKGCMRGHWAGLKRVRGKQFIRNFEKVIKTIKENKICKTIVGFTPSFNHAALVLASIVGFKQCGIIFNGLEIEGEYYDMIINSMEVY